MTDTLLILLLHTKPRRGFTAPAMVLHPASMRPSSPTKAAFPVLRSTALRFWLTREVQNGRPYAFENPNKLIPIPQCVTWKPGAAVCGVAAGIDPDALFRLEGKKGAPACSNAGAIGSTFTLEQSSSCSTIRRIVLQQLPIVLLCWLPHTSVRFRRARRVVRWGIVGNLVRRLVPDTQPHHPIANHRHWKDPTLALIAETHAPTL